MKTILPIVAGLGLVALLVGLALHSQRTLERGLPPRVECASDAEAYAQANEWAAQHGGAVRWVLGTGSMVPYIPAAKPGEDPLRTVVAYAVTQPGAKYADIKPGNLCTYRPEWDDKLSYIHGAAQQDGGGWIMSGLNNDRSESHWRMTAQNFTGLVAHVYVWPQ